MYVKPIGINQSHWSKHRFKIDRGAYGNLMPLRMFKSLYKWLPSSTTVNSAVHLLDYNKQEIKQLGTCHVSLKFWSTVKPVHFYIVPDRLKPILGVGDALALGLTSFHCPIYEDWQSNCDLTNSVDSIHSHTPEFTMGTLTKRLLLTIQSMPIYFQELVISNANLYTLLWNKMEHQFRSLQEGYQLPWKTN